MKIGVKPILFIMANLISVVILVLVLLMYQSVYAHPGDEMILTFIIPADLGFLVIGICLFILGKFFPIPLINKLLPFISVPALFLPAFFASSKNGMLAGMLVATVLIILTIFTTVTTLKREGIKAIAEVTTKEQKSFTKRGIAAFTRWGALSFGFGALVGLFPAWILAQNVFGRPRLIPVPFGGQTPEPHPDAYLSAYFPLFIEYAVMGGIAGALIGGLVLKNRRKSWQLAMAGALGFGFGSILPYLTGLLPTAIIKGIPYGIVPGAILGAVGGGALGLALKHWRKALILAIAGAVSFSVTHEILKSLLFPNGIAYFELGPILILPVEAAVTGAVLSTVLGYLLREKEGI